MIGLKLVNVKKELAEKHYEEHKDKPFYNELIDYITGKLHNENVVAIVYRPFYNISICLKCFIW